MNFSANMGFPRQKKKQFTPANTFGDIAVEEPLRRVGTRITRPFSERAGIICRATSLPLQRALADFGADVAFGQVPDKLKEHYGITLPVSTIQRITERHAEILRVQENARVIPAGKGAGTVIGEIDGTMVPVVEASPDAKNQHPRPTHTGPGNGGIPAPRHLSDNGH